MHSFMLAVSEAKLPDLMSKLKEYCVELTAELDAFEDPKDAVYCLTMQFFPVSRAKAPLPGSPHLH